MGFPFEIITMLASTVLGGVMSVWAESRKSKAEAQKLLIKSFTRRQSFLMKSSLCVVKHIHEQACKQEELA